jgi:hypothetical protein
MGKQVPFSTLLCALAGQIELSGHPFGDETPVAESFFFVEFAEDFVFGLGPDSFLIGDH